MKPIQYRLDLAYTGANFQGWQTQPEKNGVQDHLQQALAICLRQDIKVVGSSRTDSGVHAEHQVASFLCQQNLDEMRLLKSVNALLPIGIRVQRCQQVSDDFHPIRSSLAKLYRYSIACRPTQSPFVADYTWMVYGLDIDKLLLSLKKFNGEHDFTSFCAKDSGAKTFTRRILQTHNEIQGDYLHIYILGEGFLKQMVRNIVGTLVEVGLGRLKIEDLDGIFAARDRNQAGRTAPAQGLSLVRVFYGEPVPDIGTFLLQQPSFRFMV